VVVPIDLFARAGWMPGEDRLIGTLLGRSIVMPVGRRHSRTALARAPARAVRDGDR
jgi:hypothetical protein